MSLKDAALFVREHAYAPYSGVKVGAAVRGSDGAVYRGCNVENADHCEGIRAEASAIAAMVAAGVTRLTEVYLVADYPRPMAPSGGSRQKLAEFADADVKVTLATVGGEEQITTVGDLLPGAFQTSETD